MDDFFHGDVLSHGGIPIAIWFIEFIVYFMGKCENHTRPSKQPQKTNWTDPPCYE